MGVTSSKSLKYQVYKACNQLKVLENGAEAPDENTDETFTPGLTAVRMLCCAIDYKGTSSPLTCTQDGDNITALARQCGVTDITYIKDNQCTKEGVLGAIAEVGGKCSPGDFFIFFFAGHGANIPDDDGDEPDGQDESLCTVTATGDIDFSQFLRDDDFAIAVTSAVPQDCSILIMCDCCHSGTVGDFDNSAVWEGYSAVSMSGCKDSQTSGDTGKGGIWTHSCLIAIQEMQAAGMSSYSCAQLYNKQLEKDDEVFKSAQDIQMHWTAALNGPEDLAWPLVPQGPYTAPWNYMSQMQRDLKLS